MQKSKSNLNFVWHFILHILTLMFNIFLNLTVTERNFYDYIVSYLQNMMIKHYTHFVFFRTMIFGKLFFFQQAMGAGISWQDEMFSKHLHLKFRKHPNSYVELWKACIFPGIIITCSYIFQLLHYINSMNAIACVSQYMFIIVFRKNKQHILYMCIFRIFMFVL